MLDLKLLTRNFHDQLCERVELNDEELLVYISAYEWENLDLKERILIVQIE